MIDSRFRPPEGRRECFIAGRNAGNGIGLIFRVEPLRRAAMDARLFVGMVGDATPCAGRACQFTDELQRDVERNDRLAVIAMDSFAHFAIPRLSHSSM